MVLAVLVVLAVVLAVLAVLDLGATPLPDGFPSDEDEPASPAFDRAAADFTDFPPDPFPPDDAPALAALDLGTDFLAEGFLAAADFTDFPPDPFPSDDGSALAALDFDAVRPAVEAAAPVFSESAGFEGFGEAFFGEAVAGALVSVIYLILPENPIHR